MTSEGKMEIAADCRVKPVIRFSSGMEERTFPSILEAARWCVGHRGATSPEAASGGISKVIRGLGATAYGFRWRRVGESPRDARFLTPPRRWRGGARWMAARRGHGAPKSLKGNVIKAANGRISSAYGFHWRTRDA